VVGPESVSCNRDVIAADGQIGKRVEAVIVGRDLPLDSVVEVDGDRGCLGNDGVARVADSAGDTAADACPCADGAEEHQDQGPECDEEVTGMICVL
jgi:hypothetical protein